MPRPPRLHVPGGVYHVVLRGNHRQPIFLEPSDRAMLDEMVASALARSGARAHAYCWMTNHVHLAIQVADLPLGPTMQSIASQYARWFQRRLPTSGHLFERRYRAVLVDADDQLLRLVRYIHLNPVRAGMVPEPAAYPWSGHRAYLGLERVPWLTIDFTLGILARTRASARRAYARLIADGGDPHDSEHFNRGTPEDGRVLGSEEFRSRLTLRPDPAPTSRDDAAVLEDIVVATAARFGVSVDALASASKSRVLSRARCEIADRAMSAGAATLAGVARRLNRGHSSLHEALERWRRRPQRS